MFSIKNENSDKWNLRFGVAKNSLCRYSRLTETLREMLPLLNCDTKVKTVKMRCFYDGNNS